MWRKELHDAIKLAGSQSKLARQIGIHRRVVNKWVNQGTNISFKHALLIEAKNEGKVLAEELSPHERATILILKNYWRKR